MAHLHEHLDEEMLVEAWMLAKHRTKMRCVLTKGARESDGPLTALAAVHAARGPRGVRLWEGRVGRVGCPFERELAAAGIADWADVTACTA